jgi:hypothetical protein
MKRTHAWLVATLLLAGCATTGSLGSAAERLDRSAQRFYDEVYTSRASAHTADDAAALVEAARDFNRAVDRRRSRDDLEPSFDRVAERYHHLRRQLGDRDPRYGHASLAFERVTEAYLDVDRAMNHPDRAPHYP